MKKFNHILVGIDFSPGSRSALATAVRLAARDEAKVTAIHVIDPVLASELKTAHGFTDKQLFDSVAGRVRHFMDQTELGADLVDIDLDVGNAFVAVVDACHRHKADLLILGSRGSEHAHNQIGAVAAKCIRKAPTDVLLVRSGVSGPFKQILACVDFSETSAKAVRNARHVAEIDRAKLECLYVHQSALALSVDYGGFVPPLTEAVEGADNEVWKKDLDTFLTPLLRTAEKLEWTSVVDERVGIRDAIFDHAKASKTDLVVLGTRGKTDLRALIFGTTAEKIISHAPCSILAIKPEGFEYPLEDVPAPEQASAPLA
jgi:nucleotide-binding universal stress UspA family protein